MKRRRVGTQEGWKADRQTDRQTSIRQERRYMEVPI